MKKLILGFSVFLFFNSALSVLPALAKSDEDDIGLKKAVGILLFNRDWEVDEETQNAMETLCDWKWEKCYDKCEEELLTYDHSEWDDFVGCTEECQESYDYCLSSVGPTPE